MVIGAPRDPMNPETRQHIALIAFFAWVGLGADGLARRGHATAQARNASAAVLLASALGGVAALQALERRTRGGVLQNLAWASAYNAVAIPAAALGLVPPWAAALGMSASSLLVVGNALRLRMPSWKSSTS